MEAWSLIAGLGNPGEEYRRTRHNAGFMVADELAARSRAAWAAEKKFEGSCARVSYGDVRAFVLKPFTFMNASGRAVQALSAFYRMPIDRLLVLVDDADLPLGELRLRPGGSSGGHHGLESIEAKLGTRDFARLRIGIGRQGGGKREITGHVLGVFSAAEQSLLDQVLQRAADQAECWARDGVQKAMNRFNGVVNSPE